jgi:hypothetical protein
VRWMNPELGSHNMFIGMRAEWIRKLSPGGRWVSYFWVRDCPRQRPPLIEEHEEEARQAKGAGDGAKTVLLRWIPPVPQWEARSPRQSCAAANVAIARVIAKRVPICCKPSD